tara:strand:- start:28 stop:396 length:369 start_codon:yes stop_codon:yes gene_type:complete
MKWSDYTVGSLKVFAMKHNDLVKIPHPSKLKRAELEKELDKHFAWKGEKLQHKATGKIYTLLHETKKKETKKEEPKKEEPKKEEDRPMSAMDKIAYYKKKIEESKERKKSDSDKEYKKTTRF